MTEEAGPPRRARLELLVRRDDEESFEIRQVDSGPAFVQLRPHRAPPDSYELAEVPSRMGGNPSYILKNKATERYLALSQPELFLWEQMDGGRSVQDMATAYVLQYGEFDFEVIPRLMRKLQHAGLLEIRPGRLRRALNRGKHRPVLGLLHAGLSALENVNVSSRKVQPFFHKLYAWGGFLLFTPLALVACLAVAILGVMSAMAVWREADDVARGLGAHPVLALLIVKVLLLATVALHQMVHGLALVHYGRRVREFGFTLLHGILPTFYVDVTDIFMATRRARVVTAVSGTLVHLMAGSLWFFLAARLQPGFVQAFAAASGLIQWQTFIVALYPFCFVEMDGYHVLVDLLGLPTLKSNALQYVRRVLRGEARELGREQWVYLAYVGLSVASVAAFILFNVKIVLHALA